MAFGDQRPSAPWSQGHYWGQYDAASDLPNVAGAALQLPSVQGGDVGWVRGDADLYVCIDASLGAAVWQAISSGASPTASGPNLGTKDDSVQSTDQTTPVASLTRQFGSGADPLPAGNYLLHWSVEGRAGSSHELRVAIRETATPTTLALVTLGPRPPATGWFPAGGIDVLALPEDPLFIQIEISTTVDGSLVEVRRQRLGLIRLDD